MSRLLNPVAMSCSNCRLHEICFPSKDIKEKAPELGSADAIKGKRRGRCWCFFCKSNPLLRSFHISVFSSQMCRPPQKGIKENVCRLHTKQFTS